MDKVFAGARLRRLREERGLSQVELARMLLISPSYLNQIEHDTRPLSVTVLVRLTEVFGVDAAFFTPRDSARQLAELREALLPPDGAGPVPLADLQQLARTMPEVTEAVIGLHHRQRQTAEHLEAVTDGRTESPASMPHENVRDFFYRHQGHFEAIDRAAEALARELGTRRGSVRTRLRTHLESAHHLRVITSRDADQPETYVYDADEHTITFASDTRSGQQAFALATRLAFLEAADLLEAELDAETWPDETSRELARIGLAHHFAGAFILPYTPFFKAAQRLRYDVEALAEHFGVGYETTAQRLSTLQRPGMRGVPFIFVRADRAGNISKRQSATGFHFSRSGGTCPLWNLYDAFSDPGRVNVQLAEMPDGQRYLWTARTVTRRRGGFRAMPKTFVIGLGCELRQAGRLVYGDGFDLGQPEVTPIGPGCKTCDRPRCPQRAAPPIGRPLDVDPSRGTFAPYPLR